MNEESEYERQMRKGMAEIGRQQDIAVFYGPQPHEFVTVLGLGQKCPVCEGHGHDDAGPLERWRCSTCDGRGRLRFAKLYRLARYLPYPEGHPSKGTTWERKGFCP